MPVEGRLREQVADSPLAEKFPAYAEPFLERRGKDSAALALDGPNLAGLARVIASSIDASRFLSRRPQLLERLAGAETSTLELRGAELLAESAAWQPDDLETGLDDLRLLRRDETMWLACLDLGGGIPFEAVSTFLSQLAEAVVERAYRLTATHGGVGGGVPLGVVGMGKIAGREMTYHSDLDLIFLVSDDVESPADGARRAQRMISYLTTPTGAGIAYAVDSRLRPSGRQGTLVSTHAAYARYQREDAALWEHLALMRSRAIAGDVSETASVLDTVKRRALAEGRSPWPGVDAIRSRVIAERTDGASAVALKTGAGGLMDVDFLAAGSVLERGGAPTSGPPSVTAMLLQVADSTPVRALIEDYVFLRRVQARARWAADRAVDGLPNDGQALDIVAELVEPGLTSVGLQEQVDGALARNRAAYDSVIAAGSSGALADGSSRGEAPR